MAKVDVMQGTLPQMSERFSRSCPDSPYSIAPGNDSWIRDDSTPMDDEEKYNASSQDDHFVKWAKVIGVHKQERPKRAYLFVIIAEWSDKSRVTIYRRWKEIKELQTDLLRCSKNKGKAGDSRRYLKKTTRRVRTATRFQHGTIKKLNMIDSLNQFFEALVHFKEFVQCVTSRRFFKPNTIDLSSISWSGDGRTYFYLTSDVLNERNNDFDGEKETQSQFVKEEKETRTSQDLMPDANGTALKQTSGEMVNTVNKYSEDEPNISWPIKSTIYTALWDFDASDEDLEQNIISLYKGENVDVLDRNERGWWLVNRMNGKTNPKNGLIECGYVPASYIAPNEAQGQTDYIDWLAVHRSQRTELKSDALSSFSSISEEHDNEGAVFIADERSSYHADSSSDDLPSSSPVTIGLNKTSQFKCNKDHYHGKTSASFLRQHRNSLNNEICCSSLSASTCSSLESLTYSSSKTPKSVRRPLECPFGKKSSKENNFRSYGMGQPGTSSTQSNLKQTNSASNTTTNSSCDSVSTSSAASSSESLTFISKTNKPYPRFKSMTSIETCHQSLVSPETGSRSCITKPVNKRRLTSNVLPSYVQSIPNLSRTFSFDSTISPSVDDSSSVLFLPQKGVDYISTTEYSAEKPDEISFKEGVIITVLSRTFNGWWLANYNGRTGLVPGVHLMRYKDPIRRLSRHVLSIL